MRSTQDLAITQRHIELSVKALLPSLSVKGGPGSGDHGHAGRPGQVGGSSSSADVDELLKSVGSSVQEIRALRDEIRASEGEGAGACGIVSEELASQHGKNGWQEEYGEYIQSNGVPEEHAWVNLPDGRIFDPTSDQWKEGHDMRIVGLEDSDRVRYRAYKLKTGVEGKGGPGSGDHGHAGRPGEVGGSSTNGTKPWYPSTGDRGDPVDYATIYKGQEVFVRSASSMAGQTIDGSDIVQGSNEETDALRGRLKSGIAGVIGPESGIGYERANELLATWSASSSDTKPDSIALQLASAEKFGVKSEYLDQKAQAMEIMSKHAEAYVKASDWEATHGVSFGGHPAYEAYSIKNEMFNELRNAGLDKEADAIKDSWFQNPMKDLTDRSFEDRKADAAKFLDTSYKITQATLAEAGVKEMVLFRGMQFTDPENPEPNALAAIPHYDNNSMTGGVDDVTINANPLSSFSLSPHVAEDFTGSGGDHAYILSTTVPASRIVCLATTGVGCLTEQEAVVYGGPITARVVRTRYPMLGDLTGGNFPSISDVPIPIGAPA